MLDGDTAYSAHIHDLKPLGRVNDTSITMHLVKKNPALGNSKNTGRTRRLSASQPRWRCNNKRLGSVWPHAHTRPCIHVLTPCKVILSNLSTIRWWRCTLLTSRQPTANLAIAMEFQTEYDNPIGNHSSTKQIRCAGRDHSQRRLLLPKKPHCVLDTEDAYIT